MAYNDHNEINGNGCCARAIFLAYERIQTSKNTEKLQAAANKEKEVGRSVGFFKFMVLDTHANADFSYPAEHVLPSFANT